MARSTAFGEYWGSMTADSLPANPRVGGITKHRHYFFAGVFSSSIGITGVFRSETRGLSWIRKNRGLSNTEVTSIVSAGDNVYAATSSGVFVSTDDGDNWSLLDKGWSTMPITGLFNINGHLVAGTSTGIFKWMNGKWWDLTGNLPSNTRVNAVVLHGGAIVIGTSNGIFATPLSTLSVKPELNNTFHFYPNPANSQLSISTGSSMDFSINILNTLGQDVYSATFKHSSNETLDVAHLPKGVYIIHFQSGELSLQRKLIIE